MAEKTVRKLAAISGIAPVTDGTVSDTLRRMDKSGIDMCVCLNIATSLTAHTTINNTTCENNRIHKGKMVFFGSVNPFVPDALDELCRIRDLGIPGIKLHPDYQNFFTDDKRLFDFYDRCRELDLITVFHSGWDCYSPNLIHSAPHMNRKVAENFPGLRMVLAHFGGLAMYEEVLSELAGLPNVWFDTAMCGSISPDKKTAMAIINKHPAEHILLGSDCPWEDPADSARYIESPPLSDDRKEMIFKNNALSLLSLK